MMKPSKPILLVTILTLFVALFSLSACGGNQQANSPTPAPAPTPPPSTSTPAPEKPVDEKAAVIELVAKGSLVNEMSYVMVMVGAGLTSESKAWLKGNKMKLDTTFNGEQSITIFDLTKGELLTYMPSENMGFKMDYEEYQGQDSSTPVDYVKNLEKNEFVFVGNEKVNGLECKVIQIANGTDIFKQWISVKYGVVVKVQQTYDGQEVVIEYRNLKVGEGSVDDEVFRLPEGLEILDMNQMMQFSQ